METPLNVFLFVPNIIGYVRIVLALIAFARMSEDYVTAVSCYLLSGFLDAWDGYAARYLNQGSKFGAMLDMLTDRAALMGLLVVLSNFYPAYTFWFQLSMIIDIVSHWIHMHSALLTGKSHHKTIDLSGNVLLRIYYTSRPVLFCMCAGNELFYASLYALHFSAGPTVLGCCQLWKLVLVLSAPIAFAKTVISLVHLFTASYNIAALDCAERNAHKSQ